MHIVIRSTQIKNGEYVEYVWMDARKVIYKGDSLMVTTNSGYVAVYTWSEFISFSIA